MSGYPTPEDAVRAADSVPPQYVNVLAVHCSPNGTHAVVFIAYNEAPQIEPYVVLCEKTPEGWVEGHGVASGEKSWMSTTEDGSLGVETTWQPRTVRWDVPAWDGPEPEADGSW